MIFERMASINVFRKVRQLEALTKSSPFITSCRVPQLSRSASHLASINRCLSPINTTNCRVLTKLPVSSTLGTQQNRTASSHGDHVRLWVFERLVSVALPILLPAAFIAENPIVDGLLATCVVMHTHWGLEAVIVDYARPIVVGNILPKICMLLLYIVSGLTLAGLFVLIYNGPGIGKAIKNIWAIGKKEEKSG